MLGTPPHTNTPKQNSETNKWNGKMKSLKKRIGFVY